MSAEKDDAMHALWVWATLLVIVCIGAYVFYDNFRGPINWCLILLNRGCLWIITQFPGTEEAAAVNARLAFRHPASFTFQQIVAQTAYVGEYLRWGLPLPIALLGWWSWRQDSTDSFKTVYEMEQLLQNNVANFPCMAPVAFRKLLNEPYDKGPWRTARQPIQFVSEHKLLLDKEGTPVEAKLLINKDGLANLKSPLLGKGKTQGFTLATEAAKKLFEKQMGKPFTSLKALPGYQKGLAAALIAFGQGEKDEAQALLDQMSLSFQEPGKGKPLKIDIRGADEILKRLGDSEELKYFTENHESYAYSWFPAALVFARKKGVLPTSQFIWLRPTNRVLWYVLNQLGGRTAWVEASGPWAHNQAEEVFGQPIFEPEVRGAVAALEQSLLNSGWLPEPEKPAQVPASGGLARKRRLANG